MVSQRRREKRGWRNKLFCRRKGKAVGIGCVGAIKSLICPVLSCFPHSFPGYPVFSVSLTISTAQWVREAISLDSSPSCMFLVFGDKHKICLNYSYYVWFLPHSFALNVFFPQPKNHSWPLSMRGRYKGRGILGFPVSAWICHHIHV